MPCTTSPATLLELRQEHRYKIVLRICLICKTEISFTIHYICVCIDGFYCMNRRHFPLMLQVEEYIKYVTHYIAFFCFIHTALISFVHLCDA